MLSRRESPHLRPGERLNAEPPSSQERRPTKITDRQNATMMLVGDVANRLAILVDDLADTANTITRAAKLLKKEGATKVYALLTHGVLSGDAIERINGSALDKVVVTNSVPQHAHRQRCPKLEVLDVGTVFAEVCAVVRASVWTRRSFTCDRQPRRRLTCLCWVGHSEGAPRRERQRAVPHDIEESGNGTCSGSVEDRSTPSVATCSAPSTKVTVEVFYLGCRCRLACTMSFLAQTPTHGRRRSTLCIWT